MDLGRTKRIIYISALVILLGLVGFFLYWFFLPTERGTPETARRIRSRVPAAGEEKTAPESILKEEGAKTPETRPELVLTQITDFSVVSPGLNKAGDKVLFYKKDGGDLFSSDFSGKEKEKISNLTIVGPIEALWSGDRAAVFYLDGETRKGFLHVGTSSTTALPQDVRSFSWSPDGRSVVYAIRRDERLNLITADDRGRNPKTIFSTPLPDAQISWITSDKIALQTAPSGFAEGYLFLFSRSSQNLTRLVGPRFGLSTLWSPDGSRVIFSSTDSAGRSPTLTVADATGKRLFEATIQTIPEKCVWSTIKEMYCAVPRGSLTDAVWPDNYLQGVLNTSDRIVRLDFEKKEIKGVFNERSFDMSNLILSKNRDYLLFVDRKDGTLWSLKIN